MHFTSDCKLLADTEHLSRMKFFVIFAVALASTAAATVDEAAAPIVKSSFESDPEGSFQYAYETGNGIYAQAAGSLKNTNSEYPALEISGANKHTAPDGQIIEFTYVADENGYRPSGSHLPVGPPVPEAIARAIAYIAAHPPQPANQYEKAPEYRTGGSGGGFGGGFGGGIGVASLLG